MKKVPQAILKSGGENIMVEEDQEHQEVKTEKPKTEPKEEPVYSAPKSIETKKEEKPDKFWKVATIVLIVLLGFFLLRGGNEPAAPTGGGTVPTGNTKPPSTNIDMEKLADDDPFLGDADAPVTIVEFSDYECPFCARFYSQTLSQIKSNYIETGKVKFVYRDFPLGFHQQAVPAALAANCAGEQGKYFEYHDKLFLGGGAAGKTDADYKTWAEELGLNVAEWETCLSDPAQAAEIQKDFRDGSAAGITGTPGFIINGQLISGAQPFSVFKQIIDAALN